MIHNAYNVIILPDAAASTLATHVSESIAKTVPTKFILGKSNIPHITLYQAQYPDSHTDAIEDQLAHVSSRDAFTVSLDTVSTYENFIFWDVAHTDKLLELHTQILHALNPLREGSLLPSVASIASSTKTPENVKSNIAWYGSVFVGDLYRPHVTLSRLQNSADLPQALTAFQPKQLSFEVSEIHLANIGEDGTVNQLYASFPFKQKND